jgi:cob(I)alamin adenosyltransferase
MLIIFTGDGKGKTTAALGQALRAVGNGSRVLVIQFIKGPWESGEHIAIKKLEPQLTIIKKGLGFVGIGGDKFDRQDHVNAAEKALAYARRAALTREWNIIVLDEIWNAVRLGLLQEQAISNLLDIVVPRVEHLIMTGRGCPDVFIKRADLVTEMREVKHPFAHGVAGVKNLEY